jgi:hypothetical protein
MIGIPLPFAGEFEVVIMIAVVIEEIVGSHRVPDRNDCERALVGTRKPSTRAKWLSSRVHAGSVLKKCLTPPTLFEMAILRQQPEAAVQLRLELQPGVNNQKS